MQTLIRTATQDDIDTLFSIRTSVVQNHLSVEQMAERGITPQVLAESIAAAPNGFYQRLGWVVVGQVDGDDVRYEKSRAQ